MENQIEKEDFEQIRNYIHQISGIYICRKHNNRFSGPGESPHQPGFRLFRLRRPHVATVAPRYPEKGITAFADTGFLTSLVELLEATPELHEKRVVFYLVDEIVFSDETFRNILQDETIFQRDFLQTHRLIEQIRVIARAPHESLPLDRQQMLGHPRSRADSRASTTGEILLADDSKSVRNYVTRILTDRGFSVRTFENGQDLMNFLSGGGRGNLILIDNQMPVKSGITTLTEIKSTPHLRDTPVLFLSAIRDKDTIVEALELGADDFMEYRNHSSEIHWEIRIGLHSGPVVGGIVGLKKYLYDVFGDTINTASRMESSSRPNRINISEELHSLIKDQFEFDPRRKMEVKGKGKIKMYFLEKEKEVATEDEPAGENTTSKSKQSQRNQGDHSE